jgi:hypothetical protein
MGSGVAKGHAARGVTPLRLSIKAGPSAVRAVCREAETCPCVSSAVPPLQWPQAFRWDRLERRLPSWSGYYAPTTGRLSGCLASLVAPPSHLCVEARGEILAWHVASHIFDLPFRCDAAECMRRPIGSRVHRERSQRARAKRPAHGRPTKHEVPQPSSSKVAMRVRDGPWRTQSTTVNTAGTRETFRITHPYHPLYGREYKLITYCDGWGNHRVYFHDDAGRLRKIPACWTDVVADDPFVVIAAGRSAFRVADLFTLADLIEVLQPQRRRRNRRSP